MHFKLIPLGRVFYHVLLNNMAKQCTALTAVLINVFPGIFRVNSWTPDFNMDCQKQSMPQVCVRIYGLPLEYRKPQKLFNVASGVGAPRKIDPKILFLDIDIFAKILVEVDLSNPLPDRILVTKEKGDFFVKV